MQQSNLDVSKEKLIFDMKKYVQNVIRNSQFHLSSQYITELIMKRLL